MRLKVILKVSVFLLIFLNSYLLLGNNVNIKPFTFELSKDVEIDTQLSAITIEDDWISYSREEMSILTTDSIINTTLFERDTIIEVYLAFGRYYSSQYQIEFRKRDNLNIFLLSPMNKKDGFYELFIEHTFHNEVIRFKGKDLSKVGIATLFSIQKTIDYSNDIELLSIKKGECDDDSYLGIFNQYHRRWQVIDISYEAELLTFKLLKKSNCCEEATFTYIFKPQHPRVPALLVTRTATYDSMYEECECDCLFCYVFVLKTNREFKCIDFRFKENE